MSTTTEAGTRRKVKADTEKKPFWKLDLGKKSASADEDSVEHAPFTPTLPAVNLLPPAVRDSVRIGKIRKMSALLVVILCAGVGALWYLQGSSIEQAETQLAAAQQQNATLRTQLTATKPIELMYQQITGLQAVVNTTMASQPESSLVVAKLQQAGRSVAGNPVAFTSIQTTYSGIPAPGSTPSLCPNPNPFGSEVIIGCVAFNASATNRQQVSELLRAIEADPLFVGPYVTTTSLAGEGPDSVVTFAGSAGITLDALETKLTKEQLDILLAPPAPAASPSPEATS